MRKLLCVCACAVLPFYSCKNLPNNSISNEKKIMLQAGFNEMKPTIKWQDTSNIQKHQLDTVNFSFSSGWDDSVLVIDSNSILFASHIKTDPTLSITNKSIQIIRCNRNSACLIIYIFNRKVFFKTVIDFKYRYVSLASYDGYKIYCTNKNLLVY